MNRITPERQAIIDLLEASDKPLQSKEIAKKLKKKIANTSNLLTKLSERKLIKCVAYGVYTV